MRQDAERLLGARRLSQRRREGGGGEPPVAIGVFGAFRRDFLIGREGAVQVAFLDQHQHAGAVHLGAVGAGGPLLQFRQRHLCLGHPVGHQPDGNQAHAGAPGVGGAGELLEQALEVGLGFLPALLQDTDVGQQVERLTAQIGVDGAVQQRRRRLAGVLQLAQGAQDDRAPVLQGVQVVGLREALAVAAVELQRRGGLVVGILHHVGTHHVDRRVGKVGLFELGGLAVVEEEQRRRFVHALTHGAQALVAGGIGVGRPGGRGGCGGCWGRWGGILGPGTRQRQHGHPAGQNDRQKSPPKAPARRCGSLVDCRHHGSGPTGMPLRLTGGFSAAPPRQAAANVAPALG